MKIVKKNKTIKKKLSLYFFNAFDFFMTKFEKINFKKNSFFFVFFSIFSYCFFSAIQNAKADYVLDLDPNNPSSPNYVSGCASSPIGGGTVFAQSFIPRKSNINRVAMTCSLNFGQTMPQLKVYLCKGVPIDSDYLTLQSVIPCAGSGNKVIASSSYTSMYCNYGSGYTNIDLPLSTVNVGQHYFIQAFATSTLADHTISANINSGTLCAYPKPYASGMAYSYHTQNNIYNDINLWTYYDSTQVGAMLNVISPQPNEVITLSEIINFKGTISNGSGIEIKLGQPNQSPGIDLFSASFVTGSDYTYDFKKTLSNNTYWIWYYVSKGTTTTISTSTLYVEADQGAIRRQIIMDEATICAGIDKTTFFGGIECGFKKVIAWAIYPSDEMEVDMKVSYENFKNAFPFNAFFTLTDTLTNTMASTTMNTNGTFDVPMINKQGDIIIIPVVSSSSMGKAVGNDNAILIRNTISWLLWLALAFLVFIQFKKF